MKTMIETFTSVFFIAISSALLASMISSYLMINNARNYHLNIVDRLENSDYQQEYIDSLISEAMQRGYELSVEDVTFDMRRPCYLVRLKYNTGNNAFNLINKVLRYEGVIEGYAS